MALGFMMIPAPMGLSCSAFRGPWISFPQGELAGERKPANAAAHNHDLHGLHHNQHQRRIVMNRLLACVLLAFSTAALGQACPSKPVRIVVAYPPGGGIDVMARQLADKLQPAGASPWSWRTSPARTPSSPPMPSPGEPDAHTILMTTDATFSINPHLYSKLPYDARRDFIPATMLVLLHQFLVAHPSLPANNVPELIALAKAKPGTTTPPTAAAASRISLAKCSSTRPASTWCTSLTRGYR